MSMVPSNKAKFTEVPKTSGHHAYRTGTKTQRKIERDMNMNQREADNARRGFIGGQKINNLMARNIHAKKV